MGIYQDNRTWSDMYGLQMKSILKRFRGVICDRLTPESIENSSFSRDTKNCVDAVMIMPRIEAAFRVRNRDRYRTADFAKYSREFTLRTVNNGVETELQKFSSLASEDKASIYIYAWASRGEIVKATLFDMRVFSSEYWRNDELKQKLGKSFWRDNHDGTWFVPIPLELLSEEFIIGQVGWPSLNPPPKPSRQPDMFAGI